MHLHALSTAVPPQSFSQSECWEIARRSSLRERLTHRSLVLLRAVLCGDSGVKRRHFALPDPERIFDLSADELNAAYRTAAPRLAAAALGNALAKSGDKPAELDALFVCSCTGYLCPGVSSYVADQLGLRPDCFLLDIVGHGCGAALPMMRTAHDFLAAHPDARVATVAVEISSAAFFLDDDPGVLISACLFSDGAAAAIWRAQPGATGVACTEFNTLHLPQHRDRLRFEQRDGKLRNLLHASVPQLAAEAVRGLLHDSTLAPTRIIAHPGGRDVIVAVERALEVSLTSSRAVLADYGNMSSPTVLFALAHALAEDPVADEETWWLTSFGAGFSAHGCRVTRRRIAVGSQVPVAASSEYGTGVH